MGMEGMGDGAMGEAMGGAMKEGMGGVMGGSMAGAMAGQAGGQIGGNLALLATQKELGDVKSFLVLFNLPAIAAICTPASI